MVCPTLIGFAIPLFITFSGLSSFLIVRMWFGKAIDDFNKSIVAQGKNGPELIASAGNGFTSACFKAPVLAHMF